MPVKAATSRAPRHSMSNQPLQEQERCQEAIGASKLGATSSRSKSSEYHFAMLASAALAEVMGQLSCKFLEYLGVIWSRPERILVCREETVSSKGCVHVRPRPEGSAWALMSARCRISRLTLLVLPSRE